MKKTIFTLLLAVCFSAGYSQLYNNGGSIKVDPGATLVVEGDYTSTNSGSVEIDGTVELKGDLINTSGGIALGSTGTLKFKGTSAQEITGAASTTFYCAVEVDNTSGVALTNTSTGNDQVLANTCTLTNGNITLNNFDLTMGSTGISGAGATKYVVTNGTGELKSVVTNSNITFPVGNTTYNPVILNNAGTSDTYGVIATETMPTNWTTANHAVGRTWVVSEATAGNSSLTLTPQWAQTHEQASFDRTDCSVGFTTNDGTSFTWAASGSASGIDPYTLTGSGLTGVGKFVVGDYYHEGIDLNMDVFLAGPFNGTNMNAGLTIPTTDPYGNGVSATAPANTVDWIEVELRDATTPSTVLKSYSFFVDINGNVLNTDGNVFAKMTGITKGSYYVAVRHRNHLGACTGSAISFTGVSGAFDFTNTGSSLYGTNAERTIGSIRALWAGDANGDGSIIYQGTGNDPTSISGDVLGDPGNTGSSWTYIVNDGYSNNDINMDAQIIYQGTGNDPTYISNSVLGHPGNTGSSWTYTIAQQLP